MAIPRLHIKHAMLLIVDVQEHALSSIVDASRVITNSAVLLRLAVTLNIPYVVCELNAARLGRTVQDVSAAMSDPSNRIERTSVSAANDLVLEELDALPRPTVLIAGVEAHIAIQQTALDLLQRGVPCFLCRDAISAAPREQIDPAVRRLERAGATTVDVRSAVWELLSDTAHPLFEACAGLLAELEG